MPDERGQNNRQSRGGDIVAAARRVADEVLFPAAMETDAADTVPSDGLDVLAQAGLYGLTGPVSAGGLDADFQTVCAVVEALSSGCLTTAFVWAQHIGAVLAAGASENEVIRGWVPSLCSGERRAGLALGGAPPGPARLKALETGDGWVFDGSSPFVSGWGRIDVVHTAARTDDGRLVWAFVDARPGGTLAVERLGLVALNATATVRADFVGHPVPSDRVSSVVRHSAEPPPPELLRIHASFALGVAVRCCGLLGPTPLDEQLARVRAELDRLDPATIQQARGAAGEVALRAGAALAVAAGSRALLLADHTQRLVREALFTLVYALRPASRDEALAILGARSR
jgi:alkylation response protein AidB-like acyl-CoA dehydrogenase